MNTEQKEKIFITKSFMPSKEEYTAHCNSH